MSKLILIFLCLFVICPAANSQFFVSEGQPCPGGGEIKLDTIFYNPDKPLPFDKCFYLRLRLPSYPVLSSFAIVPVDQSGKKDVRKRDLRVYNKSLQNRNKLTWADFRNPKNKIDRIFTSFKKYPVSGGKETEYVLYVSPLDPNREYQLVLISTYQTDLETLQKIEESLLVSTPVPKRILIKTYDDARKTYKRILNPYNSDVIGFKRYNFLEYFSIIDDCSNKIFLDTSKPVPVKKLAEKHQRKSRSFSKYYSFFLAPSGVSVSQSFAELLSTDKQIKMKFDNELPALSARAILSEMSLNNVNDVNGNIVNYFTSGNYDLFILETDTIHNGLIKIPANSNYFGKVASIVINSNPTKDEIIFTFNSTYTPVVQCKNISVSAYKDMLDDRKKVNDNIAEINCIDTAIFTYLFKEAIKCPCEENGIKNITEKDDLLKTISVFYNKHLYLKEIQSGISSIKNPYSLVKESDLESRLLNIQVSLTQAKLLREFIAKVETSFGFGNYNSQLKCIAELENQLTKSIDLIKTLNGKLNSNYANAAEEYQLYRANSFSNGSSQLLDLQGSSRFRIVPDFGLLGILKGSEFDFQDLTPYLGFHINFRSIDKNIPMRMVRYKSWRHYFSFMAGITLRSLKIEGKREDFFGNNNLITGLGFRLNNYLRITGGVVWFRSIDTNPLSTDKPLAYSGFTGLSLDLELQELFGGLKNLFK